MRTQDEIVARYHARKMHDMFGFEVGEYIDYLDYEHAQPFLKDGVTKEEWEQSLSETESPAERIKNYMEFAFEKANNFRGISAARSLMHMIAWLWLDGQDEFLAQHNLEEYEFYGKDHLVAICKLYGIDHTQYDDGVRQNEEE